MRVLFVDHSAQLSGGEIALVRLLNGLDDIEAVVLLGEDGPLVPKLEAAGARVIIEPFAGGSIRKDGLSGPSAIVKGLIRSLSYVRQVRSVIRTVRPDVIHSNSLKSGYYASAAAALTRVPLVWHLRDRLAPDYLPRLAIWLTRALLRTVPRAIICNSAETARWAPPSRKHVIPSPIIYDAHEGTSETASKTIALAPFTVVMVGRLAPWKGQDVFIDAFAQSLRGESAQGIIAGSAMFGEHEFERSLRSRLRERQIEGQITMAGFVEDVPALLQRARVLVHASRTAEPFGQVVVEGLAASLAVIATDAGGPSEILSDGVDGLLVPPGDVEAMAAALRMLFDDEVLRQRLAAAGRERAADFSPEIVGRNVMSVYASVARTTRNATGAARGGASVGN